MWTIDNKVTWIAILEVYQLLRGTPGVYIEVVFGQHRWLRLLPHVYVHEVSTL